MGWVAKKIVFKKSRPKNFPNPSHGRVGWVGGYNICENIIKKKSVCLVLALGWSENINKKKYMGDGVKGCFHISVITCGWTLSMCFVPIIPYPFFVMCRWSLSMMIDMSAYMLGVI